MIAKRGARTALAALAALASLAALAGEVARGDASWETRARGAAEGRPLEGPILASILSYESALAERPDALSVRWKLLRSLHFAATFASEDESEKRRALDRATRSAEEGLERLARRAGAGERLEDLDPETLLARLEAAEIPPEDVARLYFWSAISWGSWSRTVGLLSAVQQGVANRLHRYTLVTLSLEPAYDDGGPYRLLGRLHANLPRVPFLSGWVDRDQAIPLLERGYRLAPEHPGNRLLLAITLLDLAPARRAEALELLALVGALEPRPSMRIEDLSIREEARARLDELGEGAPAPTRPLTRR